MTSTINDVLLIYPPFEKAPVSNGKINSSFPLGLGYLSSSLKKAKFNVSAIDCNVWGDDVGRLADHILSKNPNVLGISVSSPASRFVKLLIKEVRERGVTSTIPYICVGGHHIGSEPASSRLLGADAYFVGESDESFIEFCRDPKAIDGPVFSPPIPDLDSLSFPDREVFDPKGYAFNSLICSRGCPFNCAYCGMANSGNRRRSVENISLEISDIAEDNPGSIDFADDCFLLDRDYALEVADTLDVHSLQFSISTRCDLVDDDIISSLRARGLSFVSFGVESGDYRVRRELGKDISDDAIIEAFGICRDLGVKTRAFAMVGTPGETVEDVKKTYELIRRIDPDEVVYSPCILYPGTKVFDIALSQGKVEVDVWSDYVLGKCPQPLYVPDGLDIPGILSLTEKGYEAHMLKRKVILRRLREASCASEFIDCLGSYLASFTHEFNKEDSK